MGRQGMPNKCKECGGGVLVCVRPISLPAPPPHLFSSLSKPLCLCAVHRRALVVARRSPQKHHVFMWMRVTIRPIDPVFCFDERAS